MINVRGFQEDSNEMIARLRRVMSIDDFAYKIEGVKVYAKGKEVATGETEANQYIIAAMVECLDVNRESIMENAKRKICKDFELAVKRAIEALEDERTTTVF